MIFIFYFLIADYGVFNKQCCYKYLKNTHPMTLESPDEENKII